MNPLHLLWIVPLSAGFGAVTAAIFSVGGQYERELNDEKDSSDPLLAFPTAVQGAGDYLTEVHK